VLNSNIHVILICKFYTATSSNLKRQICLNISGQMQQFSSAQAVNCQFRQWQTKFKCGEKNLKVTKKKSVTNISEISCSAQKWQKRILVQWEHCKSATDFFQESSLKKV
jgi:hypothetical protein